MTRRLSLSHCCEHPVRPYETLAADERRVADSVAEAVANAAVASGVARRDRGTRAHECASPLEAMR
jgi:hypothetical protein